MNKFNNLSAQISEAFLRMTCDAFKRLMSGRVVAELSLELGSNVTADACVKPLYRCSRLNILQESTLQFLSWGGNPAAECAETVCELPTPSHQYKIPHTQCALEPVQTSPPTRSRITLQVILTKNNTRLWSSIPSNEPRNVRILKLEINMLANKRHDE